MNVFDLQAKIGLDTTGYKSGLKSAGTAMKKVGGTLNKGFKSMAKVGVASFAAVATASVALGKKIVDLSKETAEYGDTIDKTSQRVGMTAESYQKWDYVLKINGAEMSNMRIGLKTLTNQIGKANGGAKESQEYFKKLGISMEEVKNSTREEMFGKVIKGFQGMEDSTERAALANKMFGRSGQELAPLFNQSAKSTEELMKKAEDLGFVMSEKAVKASAKFKDSLTTLNQTFKGVKNRMAGEFLPSLTKITDGLALLFAGDEKKGNKKIKKGIDGFIDSLTEKLPDFVKFGSTVLGAIGDSLMENAPKIMDVGINLLTNLIDGLANNSEEIVDGAISIIETLGGALIENVPKLFEAGTTMLSSFISEMTKEDESGETVLFKKFKEMFEQIDWAGMWDSIWSTIGTAMEGTIHFGADVIGAITDSITTWWDDNIATDENGGTLAGNLWDAIGNAMDVPLGWVEEHIFNPVNDELEDAGFWDTKTGKAADFWWNYLFPEDYAETHNPFERWWHGLERSSQTTAFIYTAYMKQKLDEAGLWDVFLDAYKMGNNVKKEIQKFFTQTLPSFVEAGRKLFDGLRKGIEEKITNISQWLYWHVSKPLMDKVKELFGISQNASSVFADIGKYLIEGLWKGISDSISWLKDKFNTLFGENGALGWVKKIWEEKSPSKAFARIGKFGVMGLEKGWEDEMSNFHKMMENDLALDDMGVNFGVDSGVFDSVMTIEKQDDPQLLYTQGLLEDIKTMLAGIDDDMVASIKDVRRQPLKVDSRTFGRAVRNVYA